MFKRKHFLAYMNLLINSILLLLLLLLLVHVSTQIFYIPKSTILQKNRGTAINAQKRKHPAIDLIVIIRHNQCIFIIRLT